MRSERKPRPESVPLSTAAVRSSKVTASRVDNRPRSHAFRAQPLRASTLPRRALPRKPAGGMLSRSRPTALPLPSTSHSSGETTLRPERARSNLALKRAGRREVGGLEVQREVRRADLRITSGYRSREERRLDLQMVDGELPLRDGRVHTKRKRGRGGEQGSPESAPCPRARSSPRISSGSAAANVKLPRPETRESRGLEVPLTRGEHMSRERRPRSRY